MMSTQRWEFFTVGQFQFGKISKWMNLNLVGNQFGSFTMGVNLKKVNINLEFVSERSKTRKLMFTNVWQHWNFREFDVGGNWKCLSVKKAERCRSSCVFRKKPRRCFDLCSFHTRRGCFSQVNHRDFKDGHIGSTNAKLALNRRKLDQN